MTFLPRTWKIDLVLDCRILITGLRECLAFVAVEYLFLVLRRLWWLKHESFGEIATWLGYARSLELALAF